MFDFIDKDPQMHVEEAEYLRLLGFPRDHVMSERSRELVDWARSWYAENGRPWMFARGAGGIEIDGDNIRFGGAEFSSDRWQAQLDAAQAHDAVLVAVGAGKECEEKARQCWQDGKPDEYFFMEMYGSAVVEHLVTRAAGNICAQAEQSGLAVLPHYSPGYSGWPVSDQPKLWSVIRGKNGAQFPAELEVMDTGMLRPKKSLLAVFGLTRHPEKVLSGSKLIPCQNCSLANCNYRRAPYSDFMPQPESVIPSVRTAIEIIEPKTGNAPVLDKAAHYTVNARALKKWSQERLQLEFGADGFVTAHFRYEGTTCSNLGRSLQYDYRIRLEPREQAYRIAEVQCAPVEGDNGYAYQCEYLKDAEDFMSRVAAEKPLVGRPLNDVLAWKRSFHPAGCYCDAASREHKWGMVFEVIHFTLAQKEAL